MKQNFTKFTLLFAAFFLSASLYGQRFYSGSIDGVDGTLTALSSSLPAPCTETISGELAAGTPENGGT